MLVINVAGLRRLNTPITVKCLKPIGPIKRGMTLNVYAVNVTTSNMLRYLIHGTYYPYRHFEILTIK